MTAAVAKMLVFPFHGNVAPWADWIDNSPILLLETANLENGHGLTEGKLMKGFRRQQRLVGCGFQPITKLFQSQNSRRGFPAGDIPKIPGTEISALGSLFIGMVHGAAEEQDCGSQIV